MAKEDLQITKESYLKLLTKYLENAQEERDLALDRYRRQDDQMVTPEDFILQGKNAVSFLSHASNRSDAFLKVAEKIQSIVFPKEEKTEVSVQVTDDFRKSVVQEIKKIDDGESSMEF